MGTIIARNRVDGSTRYTAVVRLKKGKETVHRETQTFSLRADAEKWIQRRELELANPSALILAKRSGTSLRDLIRWYVEEFEQVSRWQRTKGQHLRFLEKQSIAKADAAALTCQALVDHVRIRRRAGAGPATVANDLVWIGVVLRAAKAVRGLPLQLEGINDARVACRELRLTAKSRRRQRRPSAQELQLLQVHFARRDARSSIPMRDVMWFAIHSARRESEICRLEWSDIDASGQTGVVRDAKHPRAKLGNHRRFKFTREAWKIVTRQARGNRYIFPYNPRSIGAAFTRACALLGIEDLTFHDLRHEATSRLFERGYHIHEVAQFTLHDSWNELKRYTHLQPQNVRELGASG